MGVKLCLYCITKMHAGVALVAPALMRGLQVGLQTSNDNASRAPKSNQAGTGAEKAILNDEYLHLTCEQRK